MSKTIEETAGGIAQSRPLEVPITDLKVQYAAIKDEIDAAIAGTIDSCAFILGPAVAAFEASYAEYCGVSHCVGVSNGTDALSLALKALDIGEGDEVITTPHTFGATIEAICEVGAKPVFVDIEEDLYTLDTRQVADRVTGRTRAVIPVHLYGQTADMDPLLSLAAKHGFAVVEDAAQAQGARYHDKRAGSMGNVGCFSFYPGKNLGAYGDAGGITCNDDDLDSRLRRLRNHGMAPGAKFLYSELGYNRRMDGLQGAVLGVKLRHLDDWNERRRSAAARYNQGLADLDMLRLPVEAGYAHHVYHLYVIRAPRRDELAAVLSQAGIQTAVHYPNALHLTPAYQFLGHGEGSFPQCEGICEEILSLPMYPEIETDHIDYVVEQIHQFYR